MRRKAWYLSIAYISAVYFLFSAASMAAVLLKADALKFAADDGRVMWALQHCSDSVAEQKVFYNSSHVFLVALSRTSGLSLSELEASRLKGFERASGTPRLSGIQCKQLFDSMPILLKERNEL